MISNCRRTLALRQFFLWSVVIAVVLIACAFTHGCALPGDEASDAELAYRAALLRCVDKAATLAESKACRKQVDIETGIVRVQDGGGQ